MDNTDYFKLTKQPLVFVLAEFRFPVIMQMNQFLPEVQEKLRQKLPFYEEQQAQEVQLNQDGIEIKSSPQWAFIDKSRTKSVLLSPSRIVFSTSAYDRFEGFEEFCLDVLDTLREVVKPSFIQRIGLRYADLIVPENRELSVSAYVKPGFYENIDFSEIGSLGRKVNEFLLETEEGTMVIRTMYGHHDLSVFQDIHLPIKLSTRDVASERILLDFDHIWEAHAEDEFLSFDRALISEKLHKMHYLSRKAFWSSVTEEGIETWR
ncbi:MAG: TIGR04255 family protein [Alcaligenaceae bacterium]|nr:TIGR04255 family protein [Alcaligenaceae bacterium]